MDQSFCPKNSVFGYKTKEKRQNEKIGYVISILLRNKDRLIQSKVIAGTHTHTTHGKQFAFSAALPAAPGMLYFADKKVSPCVT